MRSAGAAVPRIGQRAPPLIVREFSSRTFDLAQDRDRVAVVSVWATWCSPRHAEMPVLQSF